MKKRFFALFMSVAIAISTVLSTTAVFAYDSSTSVIANEKLPEIGEELYGFKTIARGKYDSANAETVTFEHIKSGATLVYIRNNDENLTFNISYNTPQTDESDRNHVFEHAILASSEKYPATDIFFDVSNKTYSTYVNASTGQLSTNYMVSSMSQEQLKKMMDVYLSCMVAPAIIENENFFKREALNYTLEDKESDIQLGGTVFSEDTGYLTDMGFKNFNAVLDSLYPGEVSSNMVGMSVENYKILTYDHTKELYNKCYKFDNSIITLYGNMDYKTMLEFIDEEYLSKYEKSGVDLSEYVDNKTESKFTDDIVYIPANIGDTVENASVVNYAIDLSEYSEEDLLKLSYIANLFNNSNSIINNKLIENGIYSSFSTYVDISVQKPYIVFQLYNTNPEIKEDFYKVIKESLEEISENGVGSNYENLLKSMEISDVLSMENTDFSVNSAVLLSEYWVRTGRTDIFDIDSKVFNELKSDTAQKNVKELVKKILRPENSALVATVPKPGLAEEIENERKEYLTELKANMSEEEIDNLIEETKAYIEWNSNTITNDNVAIKPEELPMPSEFDSVNVKDLGAIKSYSAVVDNEVGKYSLKFDASSLKQEDLYYMYLYGLLIGNVSTDKYTYEEIQNLMPVYLNKLSASLKYLTLRGEDTPTLLFDVDWYCIDEDYSKSLDMAIDILEKSDFTVSEDIASNLEYIIPMIDPGRSDAYEVARSNAISIVSDNEALSNYFNTKEFYQFIVDVNNKIQSDENYVNVLANKLNEIKNQVIHKDNMIVSVIAAEGAISNAENINNTVLNELPSFTGEKVQYNFGDDFNTTGIIVEAPNQSSFYVACADSGFKGEYIPFINMIGDKYTVPTFRFKNGAYSAGTGLIRNIDTTMIYSYTYSDPNVGKTIENYKNMVKAMAEVELSQEELDGYIVAAYSSFVVPRGEYSKALSAINYEIYNFDKDFIEKNAEGIKNTSLEDMDEALAYIQKILDSGYIVIAGNGEAINADKDCFDKIIDLRNTIE